MGNRAVIAISEADTAPAIYLHWNGGRASVEGFLEAARALSIRTAGADHARTLDALAQTIARYFFGCNVGLTVYREPYGRTDRNNGDNGVYLLAPDLTIRKRLHAPRHEEIDPTKSAAIAEQITTTAPIFND